MVKEPVDSIAGPGRGVLFLVATPIGNLGDLSPRARDLLRDADLLLAEDTRHTAHLLHACGIERPPGSVDSLHEHNERARVPRVLQRLQAGARVALVSDAGTPLVSDPGASLVRAAIDAGVEVIAVPGPCAAIAALSTSGLPAQRFAFEGFLPARSVARRRTLEALATEPRTLVFYEAPHRVAEVLTDLAQCLGDERPAAIAREITKRFESTYRGTLADLARRAALEPDVARGEIVIVVHGAAAQASGNDSRESERILRALLAEVTVSQAARLAATITGRPRKELYEQALAIAQRED